jgi:hypothetical protein
MSDQVTNSTMSSTDPGLTVKDSINAQLKHQAALNSAKARVDSSSPISLQFKHLSNRSKQRQSVHAHQLSIDKENERLLAQVSNILSPTSPNKSPHHLVRGNDIAKYSTIDYISLEPYSLSSLNQFHRARNQKKIQQENSAILERINQQKGKYSKEALLKQAEQQEMLLHRISKFKTYNIATKKQITSSASTPALHKQPFILHNPINAGNNNTTAKPSTQLCNSKGNPRVERLQSIYRPATANSHLRRDSQTNLHILSPSKRPQTSKVGDEGSVADLLAVSVPLSNSSLCIYSKDNILIDSLACTVSVYEGMKPPRLEFVALDNNKRSNCFPLKVAFSDLHLHFPAMNVELKMMSTEKKVELIHLVLPKLLWENTFNNQIQLDIRLETKQSLPINNSQGESASAEQRIMGTNEEYEADFHHEESSSGTSSSNDTERNSETNQGILLHRGGYRLNSLDFLVAVHEYRQDKVIQFSFYYRATGQICLHKFNVDEIDKKNLEEIIKSFAVTQDKQSSIQIEYKTKVFNQQTENHQDPVQSQAKQKESELNNAAPMCVPSLSLPSSRNLSPNSASKGAITKPKHQPLLKLSKKKSPHHDQRRLSLSGTLATNRKLDELQLKLAESNSEKAAMTAEIHQLSHTLDQIKSDLTQEIRSIRHELFNTTTPTIAQNSLQNLSPSKSSSSSTQPIFTTIVDKAQPSVVKDLIEIPGTPKRNAAEITHISNASTAYKAPIDTEHKGSSNSAAISRDISQHIKEEEEKEPELSSSVAVAFALSARNLHLLYKGSALDSVIACYVNELSNPSEFTAIGHTERVNAQFNPNYDAFIQLDPLADTSLDRDILFSVYAVLSNDKNELIASALAREKNILANIHSNKQTVLPLQNVNGDLMKSAEIVIHPIQSALEAVVAAESVSISLKAFNLNEYIDDGAECNSVACLYVNTSEANNEEFDLIGTSTVAKLASNPEFHNCFTVENSESNSGKMYYIYIYNTFPDSTNQLIASTKYSHSQLVQNIDKSFYLKLENRDYERNTSVHCVVTPSITKQKHHQQRYKFNIKSVGIELRNYARAT